MPVIVTGVGSAAPRVAALYQNVPNPFNPTTVIRYDVAPGGGQVTLTVYDAHGRHIRTLVDEAQSAGAKRAVWDGNNANGVTVASGIYFYRLVAPGLVQTRKMMLLK